jgi:SAM-dependent methyltransferase
VTGVSRQPVRVIDPSIESHYGTGYERSRLFPGGRLSLEFVRSMELLDRLLPPPPAWLLDVGGGPGAYAAALARRGYRVHLVDPVELHVEQARQAAGSDPAAAFTAAAGDARGLSEPDQSQDAVLLFGPLYHLTDGAHRRQALSEARRVPRGRGGRGSLDLVPVSMSDRQPAVRVGRAGWAAGGLGGFWHRRGGRRRGRRPAGCW